MLGGHRSRPHPLGWGYMNKAIVAWLHRQPPALGLIAATDRWISARTPTGEDAFPNAIILNERILNC